MERHEEAVMYCLTANGETFVVPEPDLGEGWSRPDFIAIRPSKKKAYLVEVTTSGNPVGLVKKVNSREKQWMELYRQLLEKLGIADHTWSYGVLIFVRSDQYDWFRTKIDDRRDVTLLRLEEAMANWEWSDRVGTPDFEFETDALKRTAE